MEQTSNLRKAAIFMISIGTKAAAEIFSHLPERDIEKLTAEIARLENVSSGELREINDEFHNMILAQQYISAGGIDYAKEILDQAVGESESMDVVRRVQMSLQVKGFNVLEDVDSNQLMAFLQKEHPQTIALVLSQMPSPQAANILAEIPPDVQVSVLHRIAQMDRVSPDTLKAVETVLETHIDFAQTTSKLGGIKTAAEILNMVGTRYEKNILTGIAKENPMLASEIKNLMFVFEDLINLDDRSIQKVLKEIDHKELSMALKACSDEVKNKVLGNMSKRAADMIVEELEFMGPVRLREVEQVQQHVVDIIRRLEEEGEVYLTSGSDEDQMV